MYSVPVVNTKDKNVEFPDYSGFFFPNLANNHCIQFLQWTLLYPLKKNKTRLMIFLNIRVIPKEDAELHANPPDFSEYRNPLQDTAEILEYSS